MWYPGKARREAKRRAEQEQAEKNWRAYSPAMRNSDWVGRRYLAVPQPGGRNSKPIEKFVVSALSSDPSYDREPSGLTRVLRQERGRVARQPLLAIKRGYGQVTISFNRARLSEWKFVATHPRVAKRRLVERFAHEIMLREALKDAALFL